MIAEHFSDLTVIFIMPQQIIALTVFASDWKTDLK